MSRPDLRIAVRIQFHPSRAALIPRLLNALADLEDVQVVTDPGAAGKPDHWRAHRACLLAMPDDASHLVVIQEDAIPVNQFAAKLQIAIAARPESLLLAFVPGFPRERRHMLQAQMSGASYARFIVGAYVPTVCVCYPREIVTGLLAWADSKGGDRYRRPLRGADDGVLANFCRLRRIHPLALVPSICQHDDSIASIGKKMRPGLHRRAALL